MSSRFLYRRRELILGGSAALAWPLAARAQQKPMPVVGFLHSGVPEENVDRLAAYRKGLGEAAPRRCEQRCVTSREAWPSKAAMVNSENS